jgi:very-short-patch-repair endonuclease
MSAINEAYVIKQYKDNHSTYSIAKELGTYPKKIERILKKNGHQLRGKAEAQSLAIKSGRTKHPTKGKKRTDEEKLKISIGTEKRWREMSDEQKEKISEEAKKRWDEISPEKKRSMQESAGRALRLAAVEGSKAEKSLKERLMEEGYDVILHKKDLIEGNFEIDLFLPEINTIIEIDGPQHFLPIFGEKRLQDVIKFDSIKNGLLTSKGYCVIRVKYLCKHLSQSVERKLWGLVSKEVEKVRKKFPPKYKRFIELEISND